MVRAANTQLKIRFGLPTAAPAASDRDLDLLDIRDGVTPVIIRRTRSAPWGCVEERRSRLLARAPAPDLAGADAIWFEGPTTSHAGFARRVRRAAGALTGPGVVAGDRVAWVGAHHPSALETPFTCGQLGAIWVPVDARPAALEAECVLGHSGASVVLQGSDQIGLGDARPGS